MTENSLQIFNQKNNEIFQDNRNNKNLNQNSISNNINCTKAIQILISELAFIFFMCLIMLIIYVIPEYHNAKIFNSKNGKNHKFNQDPIILIHVTDPHVSTKSTQKIDGSTVLMMSLLKYNPDIFLLTGDYVDNLKKSEELGLQNLEDWKIYNKTIISYLKRKGLRVIDVSGNHDQWAVNEFNSKENHFLDNSFVYNRTNVKNKDDFFLRKIKVNINNIGLTFLLLNEYRYPVYRPPYGLDAHLSVKQLNLLENTINSLDEKEIFILSHYPVNRGWLLKSRNGNTFQEIVSNEKVYAIFTGHEHPDSLRIVHHDEKGGLEFCASAAFTKRAGLVTLDNGNLVYHEVHIDYYDNRPLFFITYPIPNEQLTSHHIFNLNNFDIRVISYYSDNSLKLKIEGDITGELKYDHTMKNGAYLYKYNVNNLKEGKYKIHVYDENGIGCDISTEFTIGKIYKGKKEKYILRINFFLALKFILIPFFLFLLIICFPFFPNSNFNAVKNIEQIIENNQTNIKLNKIIIYIDLIFLSPFFLRLRLQTKKQIKIVLRIAIFIAFIYPLILPVHFMKSIKGKIGYSFLVFVYLDNKFNYEHWAVQFTLIYYLTTLLPFILFASGKKFYNKKNKIILVINSILFFGLIIISMYINFVIINQSIDLVFLFFSTAFTIVFIFLLILFIIYLFSW